MPRVVRVSLLTLASLAVLAAGCVTPYDPSQPPRLGLGERGPGMDPVKLAVAPAPVAAPAPPEMRPTHGAGDPSQAVAAPAPPQPTKTIPATPAGRQLSWVIDALNGANLKKGVEGHLAPSFLREVPAARLRTVIRQWRRDELAGGQAKVVSISQGASPQELTTLLVSPVNGRHTQVRLGVDTQGRITTLLLSPAVDVDTGDITSWERLDQRLAALPGAASLAAVDVSNPAHPAAVHEFRADQRLAVGSTFKLCILGALAEMIRAGEATWDRPLAIRDDLKSLPSGRMQLETEATEFPLSRYAELMISVSDNTAADHLLAFVGRPRVEDYIRAHTAPDPRNLPLLSTMEMFKLKLGPDRGLAARYAAADDQTRRNMLAPGGEVAATIPSFAAAALWRAPYEIERVEWFFTTPELAAVMGDLHRLEQTPGMEPLRAILRENPGLSFDRERWKGVAYKGGSEPGVLNMTWLLERDDGRMFALAITWNDPKEPVELARLAELAGAAVRLLGKADR